MNWVGRDVVAVLGRQSFPQGAARRTGRAPLEPTRRRAVAAGCGCGRGADGGQTTACPPGLRCRNLVTLAASTAARTHGGPERAGQSPMPSLSKTSTPRTWATPRSLAGELVLTSKIDVDGARIAGGCLLRLKEGAVLHALKQASPNVPVPRHYRLNLDSPHPSALREQDVDGVTGLEGVFNGRRTLWDPKPSWVQADSPASATTGRVSTAACALCGKGDVLVVSKLERRAGSGGGAISGAWTGRERG